MGGRDHRTNCGCFPEKTLAAVVLPFLTCKGIVIFSVERFF